MIRGRSLWIIVVAALTAGVLAYFLYFWWPSPLLDGSRIDSFSYGAQGVSLRELEVYTRADDGRLDEIVRLVNEARLSSSPVHRKEGAPMVVLFRRDGLQFYLIADDGDHVGISEGDGSYLGSLDSPELAELIAGLMAGPGGS
ncbi:MAG: hypothetical protein ACYC33_11815 [Thermoleophilia bacterium]